MDYDISFGYKLNKISLFHAHTVAEARGSRLSLAGGLAVQPKAKT